MITEPTPDKHKPRRNIAFYYLIALLVLILLNALLFPSMLQRQVTEVGYNDFLNMVDNGQVQEVYTDSMLGNVALIEHGDYLVYYCGLGEDFQVEAGDVVAMGQQIGVVTAVPYEAAEEPHLHVEVRRDGVAVDPQPLLDNAQ